MKTASVDVQTEPVRRRDVEVHATLRRNFGAQTDDVGAEAALSPAALSFAGWQPTAAAVQFLRNVAPLMETQLAEPSGAAFVDYDLDTAEADEDAGCLYALRHAFAGRAREGAAGAGSAEAPRAQAATGVAWNATGSLLAAGYGHAQHRGWCRHEGGVAVWRPFRHSPDGPRGGEGGSSSSGNTAGRSGPAGLLSPRGADATTEDALTSPRRGTGRLGGGGGAGSGSGSSGAAAMPPDMVFQTPACVSCLAFHPDDPSLLAVGLSNGQVQAWDVSKLADAGGSGSSGGGGASGTRSSTTTSSKADPPSSSSLSDPALLASSRGDDYIHGDSVASIAWAHEPVSRQWLVMSVSADGRAGVWTLSNAFAYPVTAYCFQGAPRKLIGGGEGGEGGASDFGDGIGGDDGDDDDDEGGARGRRRRGGRGGASGNSVVLGASSLAFALDGRQATNFLVGTPTGGVYRAQQAPLSVTTGGSGGGATLSAPSGRQPTAAEMATYMKPGTVPGAETTVPWEPAAVAALAKVPVGERPGVARAAERHAREVAWPAVTLSLLYDARCDPRLLFSNPIVFSHAPHTGAVMALAASPFVRNLFLSGGADGRVALHSLLASRPLLVLEPGMQAGLRPVHAGAWSRARPMLFATASGDGCTYVYDLYASTAFPALTLAPDGSLLAHDGPAVVEAYPPRAAARLGGVLPPGGASGSGTGDGATARGMGDLFSPVKQAPAAAATAALTTPVKAGAGAAAAGAGGGLSPWGSPATGGEGSLSAPGSSAGAPPALCVNFNPKQRRVVATGSGDGTVRVWKLTWRCGSTAPEEADLLREFVGAVVLNEDAGVA